VSDLAPRVPKTDAEIREAFNRLVANAFKRPGAPSFASIPARPDHDADLIVGHALEELAALRARVAALPELIRCLSYSRCESCGEHYMAAPGQCILADHIEAHEALSGSSDWLAKHDAEVRAAAIEEAAKVAELYVRFDEGKLISAAIRALGKGSDR